MASNEVNMHWKGNEKEIKKNLSKDSKNTYTKSVKRRGK